MKMKKKIFGNNDDIQKLIKPIIFVRVIIVPLMIKVLFCNVWN